jgi:hypothetical protein
MAQVKQRFDHRRLKSIVEPRPDDWEQPNAEISSKAGTKSKQRFEARTCFASLDLPQIATRDAGAVRELGWPNPCFEPALGDLLPDPATQVSVAAHKLPGANVRWRWRRHFLTGNNRPLNGGLFAGCCPLGSQIVPARKRSAVEKPSQRSAPRPGCPIASCQETGAS